MFFLFVILVFTGIDFGFLKCQWFVLLILLMAFSDGHVYNIMYSYSDDQVTIPVLENNCYFLSELLLLLGRGEKARKHLKTFKRKSQLNSHLILTLQCYQELLICL